VASLVSPDITIEGGITGDGELQIDGVCAATSAWVA
jgi:cytoskeletal protein CcmA (bactofilin family)